MAQDLHLINVNKINISSVWLIKHGGCEKKIEYNPLYILFRKRQIIEITILTLQLLEKKKN